jgi:hypothetical protein
MFAGEGLRRLLTGTEERVSGEKRAREDDDVEEEARRVRARMAEEEEEIARASLAGPVDEMIQLPGDEDDAMEVARDALEDLPDSSTAMPWNTSASQLRETSVGRRGSSILSSLSRQQQQQRHGSRVPEMSPLVGRGAHTGVIEVSSIVEDVAEGVAKGVAKVMGDGMGEGEEALLLEESPSAAAVAFELFGPAAGVDTQTAGQEEWLRRVMEREARNFFGFVTAAVETGNQTGDRDNGERKVTFEQLLPPENNSKDVAAQGLYHVLSLASGGWIRVAQEVAYGEIELMIAEGAEGVEGIERMEGKDEAEENRKVEEMEIDE